MLETKTNKGNIREISISKTRSKQRRLYAYAKVIRAPFLS